MGSFFFFPSERSLPSFLPAFSFLLHATRVNFEPSFSNLSKKSSHLTNFRMATFTKLAYLLSFLVQPQIEPVQQQDKVELFHFLKAVASEELDKIHYAASSSDDDDSSPGTLVKDSDQLSTSYLLPSKTIKKASPSSNKKTSLCKGITRSDKISFARWRWGKQVLSKDGSVIAVEEEGEDSPVLRSTQCMEYLVIRNTGRPSTMCRKCYEINRTLQYGLRDMKRGKLGKKKTFSPGTLLSHPC